MALPASRGCSVQGSAQLVVEPALQPARRGESGTPTAWVPESKPTRFTEPGFPAIDRGRNEPNVFYGPKSAESFKPYFTRGWRDAAIQRAYLEATYLVGQTGEQSAVLELR